MSALYKILSIVFLFFILIVTQLVAYESNEKIIKDLPHLLGSTNEGTEFFMTFHPGMHTRNQDGVIKIFITSAYSTKVNIEIPALKVFIQKTTIPNGVIEINFNAEQAQCYTKKVDEAPLAPKVFTGRAIIITSDSPIICYGVSNSDNMSEGYLAIPAHSLGKRYIVSSFNDPSVDNGVQYLTSYTSIVGVSNKTYVDIILGGRYTNYTPGNESLKTGDKASQKLNRGDVWVLGVQGDYNDLSGTTIEATNPVAVISGSYCAYVPIQMATCNYLIEQDIPMENWGRKYHITPIYDRQGSSVLRIFGSEVYTKIYKDGNEWTYVMSVGGSEGLGYVEKRLERNIATTLSSPNTINVTQFNTSQQDDGVDASAFQMALTPVEQYNTALKWCMPGTKDGAPFHKNYLNLIYKSTVDGKIPRDLEFGKVENGLMKWEKMNTIADTPGIKIPDTDIKDSRYYYCLTIKLDSIGVYGVRAKDPIAGYIYGYGDSLNSYGFSASLSLDDHNRADTMPPLPTYVMHCEGKVLGNLVDQPTNDNLSRSNLAYIALNKAESYNFNNLEYDSTNFIPGETTKIDWSLNPVDYKSDAKAVLIFSDRAGNDTTITIEYNPTKLTTKNKVVDWLEKEINDSAESKTIRYKNESSKAIVIDSIMILSSEKGRDWDYNGFKIDPSIYKANGGELPGLKLQPGEVLSFNVIFDASTVKSDFNGGKRQFTDSIGIKANYSQDMGEYCFNKFLTAVKVQLAYPCITTGSLNFDDVLVNKSKVMAASIFNNGISVLKITGYRFVNGNSDGAFEINLREISKENPLQINPGDFVAFTITFKPKVSKNYWNTITFESNAINRCTDHDPNLELDGQGTNLLIEPIEDVIINMNSFSDVPFITNSTKPTDLVFTPYTGDSGIISVDSMLITGSNNNYNLQLIPKKDKTGILNITISADDGLRKGSTNCKVTVTDPGAVEGKSRLDNGIFISPNPANSSSISINYNLEYDCNVELSLYNSSGIGIGNLLNAYQTAGNQSFSLPINEFPAGIYFVEFRACGLVGHKSFVIVK